MVRLASLASNMNTEDKVAAAKIAIEDILRAIERATDIANTIMDRRKPQEIYAESPELFRLTAAIVTASLRLSCVSFPLFRAVGMSTRTRLTPYPPEYEKLLQELERQESKGA